MNKKRKLSQGQILRERLERYIKAYVPPYRRQRKNKSSGGKFAASYNGTYAQQSLNYRFRGDK